MPNSDEPRGMGERSRPDGGPSPGARGDQGQRTGEISVLQFLNALLRHRRLLVATPVAVAVLSVTFAVLQPATYTSTASLTPEAGSGQANRLAGLASQFGINVPTGEAGQSPQFYADLLLSRELLSATATTNFEFSAGWRQGDSTSVEGDLVEILEVEADTRQLAVAKTVRMLRDRVEVSTDQETGVVELSVTTPWPVLSRDVAERMVELVNRFNLETRKTQAAAERAFIETQLVRAESALHTAEDSLQQFLNRNRRYQNSPQLRFRYERLQRRVDLRQQVFTSLSESYEQAKIDEVRNTPVITVIEPPNVPARSDSRHLLLVGVLGLTLGGMLALLWAFGRELLVSSSRADPDNYREFTQLRREARRDLRGLWTRLRKPTE